jgi:ribosomal protein S18 acetylase RimI-like enzyme
VPVTVTIATADDAEELHAALQHLVPQLSRSNPGPSLDEVRAMLGHDSVTQFVARGEDGSILGVSTLITFPIPTAVRAWVEDVIVDEASNNQGIGRLLVDAMVDRARQHGAKTLDLTSRPSREAAHHLYLKAGFDVRDTNVYRLTLDV